MSIFGALPPELIHKCLSYARECTFILSTDLLAYHGPPPFVVDTATCLLHEVRMERTWAKIVEKRHTEYYESVKGWILGHDGWQRCDSLLQWYATVVLGWELQVEYNDCGYVDIIRHW